MKKKFLLNLCAIGVCLSLVACGNKEEAVSVPETTVVEETTEEMTVEVVMEVEEETTEVVEEVSREDLALEKINKLKTAYYDLINSKDVLAIAGQFYLETESNGEPMLPIGAPELLLDCKTNDGNLIQSNDFYPTLGSYYYDYVNNDKEKYDFKEWLLNFESYKDLWIHFFGTADIDYIVDEIFKENPETGEQSHNYVTMIAALENMPYMVSFNEITLGECVETTEYKICGVNSAYIYPIYFDGKDIGSFAIFETNDNLLNIYYDEEFASGLASWMGDWTIYTMIPDLAETVEEETTEGVEE